MAILHALEWLNPKDKADKAAIRAWLDNTFGDAVDVALGKIAVPTVREDGARFAAILAEALALIDEQHFLNWQVAFPGVWDDWGDKTLHGGFDAVVGNPPWDKIKLHEVEWFAARRREIALAQRASDRAGMIADLEATGDPLARDYALAASRARSWRPAWRAKVATTHNSRPETSTSTACSWNAHMRWQSRMAWSAS